MPASITTAERSGQRLASRPHGGPQRRPTERSTLDRSWLAVTNAENNYDYANQDPINAYDLSGLCSKKKSHSFLHSWSLGCAWRGIKDDFSGGNGKVMQAVAVTDIALATEGVGDAIAGSARIQAAIGRAETEQGTSGSAVAAIRGAQDAATKFSTGGMPSSYTNTVRAIGAAKALYRSAVIIR